MKQAAAVAERTLERLAEPLAALFTPAGRAGPRACSTWPGSRSSATRAHDSICACSVDEVCDAVLHRFAEARHIAKGLVDRTLERFGASLAVVGAVVVNPSARTRGGMVELDLPGSGAADGLQLLSETPAEEVLHEIAAADAVLVVEREIFLHPALVELELAVDGDRAEVLLREGERLMDAPPENTTAVLATLSDHARRASDRPGPGRAPRAAPPPGAGPRRRGPRLRLAGVGPHPLRGSAAVTVDGTTLANGLITVEVDPADGTFSIDGHAGLGHIVDDGDAGDTYNWSPPDNDVFVGGRRRPCRWPASRPGRCGPGWRSTPSTGCPTTSRTRPGSARSTWRCRPTSSCGPVRTSCGSPPRSTTRPGTTGCGSASRCRTPTDHSEAECAFTVVRRGWTPRAGRPSGR